MRSGVVSAAVAAAAMLAAACSSSSDPTAEPSPSSAPTSSTTATAAMRGAPQVGTCWNVPPGDFTRGHRFNDSPAVACTKPHTTETVFVHGLTEPTVRKVKEYQDACAQSASDYAGEPQEDYWIPVSALAWLPSKKQVAAGASWIRCDIGFPREWGSDILGGKFDGTYEQTVRTFPAKDAVTKHPDAVLACLQQDPQILDQWLVSCGKPHTYEETGQFAQLLSLDSYPPTSKLQRASAQCRDSLPSKEQTPAFGVTAGWQPPDAFHGHIDHLVGVCFVYRQDGTPLPPRS